MKEEQSKEVGVVQASLSSLEDQGKGEASAASRPPLPLSSGRKTRPSSARTPMTSRSRASSLSSRSRSSKVHASPQVSSAKYTPLYEPRLSMSAVKGGDGVTPSLDSGRPPLASGRSPASARSQYTSVFDPDANTTSHVENHGSSAVSHQTLEPFTKGSKSTSSRPSSAPTSGRRISPRQTEATKTITPRLAPSPRPASLVAVSSLLSSENVAQPNNKNDHTFAAGLGSLTNKPQCSATERPKTSFSRRMIDQQSLLASELYKMPQGLTSARASPRVIYGPNSTSNSQAYELDLKQVEKNGVQSKVRNVGVSLPKHDAFW